MNGWIDGCMERWIHKWMNGWESLWMGVCVVRQENEQMDRLMNTLINE